MPETLMAEADHAITGARSEVAGSVELVGESPTIIRVKELVRRAATIDGGVLITGEAGVAVESIAATLPARSPYATRPHVMVECAPTEPTRVDQLPFGSLAGHCPI